MIEWYGSVIPNVTNAGIPSNQQAVTFITTKDRNFVIDVTIKKKWRKIID